MTPDQTSVCPACSTPAAGEYCFNCAETLRPTRFSMKYIVSTIPNVFMGVEEGLTFTTKQLLKQPGKTIKAYLAGDRNRYTQPFKYLLFMCGMYALLFNWKTITGTSTDSIFAFYTKDPAAIAYLDAQYTASQSLLTIALLPVLSFMSWVGFRSNKLYFGEHLYMNSFIIGFIMFINLVFFPLMLALNGSEWVDHILTLIGLLTMASMIRIYIGMFSSKDMADRVKTVVKAVVIVIVALIWFALTSPMLILLKLRLFGQ